MKTNYKNGNVWKCRGKFDNKLKISLTKETIVKAAGIWKRWRKYNSEKIFFMNLMELKIKTRNKSQ